MKSVSVKSGSRRLAGVLLALLVLFAVAGTFFFNGILLVLSNRYPLAIDLTSSAAYGLDEQTITLLEGLKGEVSIQVLAAEASFDGSPYLVQAKNILNQYPRRSPFIRLRYVDYAAEPSFSSNYPDLSLAPGNILVSYLENTRQLRLNDLFNYSYSSASASGTAVVSSRAQEALSSAILQVTSGRKRSAALLTGAGTAQVPAFASLLRDNNYGLDEVNLVTGDLSGYDLCLLIAPTVDPSLESLSKLDSFLYNNGQYGKAMFYTMDASQIKLPNLEAFLTEWGIQPLDGAVYETRQNMTYSRQPFYPLAEYADTEAASKLRDKNIPVLMPKSKPFTLLFASRDKQHTASLLSFSSSSGVRPSTAGSDFDPAKAQTKGPLPALALATRQVRDPSSPLMKTSAILISASSNMLDGALLQNNSLSNAEYLLNALGEVTGREETVQIRPISLAGANLSVNSAVISLLGILLCGVLPGVFLLLGIGVWLYRRHQ